MTFISGPTDFTGDTEVANILDRLSPLAGGRVWETQVPDGVDLDRVTTGGVKPYIIARFANPLALMSGRSVASGEQHQPQQLSFTVIVIGGDSDSAKVTMSAVNKKLVNFAPSDSSRTIQSRGGFGYPQGDTATRPTRFQKAGFYRFSWDPSA